MQFGAQAVRNDAYKDNRMLHEDWAILEQTLGALHASATATKMLEGTHYVTASLVLVLPTVYRLIQGTTDGPLFIKTRDPQHQWVRARDMVAFTPLPVAHSLATLRIQQKKTLTERGRAKGV